MAENKNTRRRWQGLAGAAALSGLYIIMKFLAGKNAETADINDGNVYLRNSRTSTEKPSSEGASKPSFYASAAKPVLDALLSFWGLVLLSPLFAAVSLLIYIDDPGPVFFSQKRVGRNKKFFCLHKFRSMKMSAPHDVPTHQLIGPEQYITKAGRVLRKTSLDELPQLWDIFRGCMSFVGPRPALWNQEDLVAERDKYGANNISPGLTGLAQIKGRDQLEIPVKAEYDGKYAEGLREGGMKAFFMDLRCLLGTAFQVLASDGVVEGGTGELKRRKRAGSPKARGMTQKGNRSTAQEAGFEDYGYLKTFHIDTSPSNKKKVLITGEGSYLGDSFRQYAGDHYGSSFEIDVIDMRNDGWRNADFGAYDTVFHVAGLAHVRNKKENITDEYYNVNTNLAIETAKAAKAAGVKQFVFMSSMSIYGASAGYGKMKVIDERTLPAPADAYGDSKWQADKSIRAMGTNDFRVAALRPPMIYGCGAKGNYPLLSKLARRLPVFPDVNNARSMLYIDNFCEFLCLLILSGEGGVFFPQNAEYTRTAEMVRRIRSLCGGGIWITRLLNPAVAAGAYIPGRISELVKKAFGSMVYSKKLSVYEGLDYMVCDFYTSVIKTEGAPHVYGKAERNSGGA